MTKYCDRLSQKLAIELKIGSFQAEYVGKMNLYLSLLDKLEKGEDENQSIGVILCADKDHLDVEIALQEIIIRSGIKKQAPKRGGSGGGRPRFVAINLLRDVKWSPPPPQWG